MVARSYRLVREEDGGLHLREMPDEWLTPLQFAEEWHVSMTTAYEVFRRLDTRVKLGRLVRARRSEIEQRIALVGRV